jgi:hypothetical protein
VNRSIHLNACINHYTNHRDDSGNSATHLQHGVSSIERLAETQVYGIMDAVARLLPSHLGVEAESRSDNSLGFALADVPMLMLLKIDSWPVS